MVLRPVVLARHNRNDAGLSSRRINAITWPGVKPNCSRIASKLVRSSHAIWMIRSISIDDGFRSESMIAFIERMPHHSRNRAYELTASPKILLLPDPARILRWRLHTERIERTGFVAQAVRRCRVTYNGKRVGWSMRSCHGPIDSSSVDIISWWLPSSEHFLMVHKKINLPEKRCERCGRPFAWRKKWAKVWEQVRFCSDRCKRDGQKQGKIQTPTPRN